MTEPSTSLDPLAALAPPLALALASHFGSPAGWRQAFGAAATTGAAGWLELAFDPAHAALVHRHAATDRGAEPGVLFAMPAGAAVDAFVAGIDWPRAYQRYVDAVHAASEACAASASDVAGAALLLDVRRAAVHAAATAVLPGAAWRDPAAVADWGPRLPAGRAVVVYCVYGHEVGRVTALRLRALGVDARYLEGGIDAWQRAGLPTEPKAAA